MQQEFIFSSRATLSFLRLASYINIRTWQYWCFMGIHLFSKYELSYPRYMITIILGSLSGAWAILKSEL